MVKRSNLALGAGTPVYVDADGLKEDMGNDKPKKGDSFQIPNDIDLVPMVVYDKELEKFVEATTKPDPETGKVVTLLTIAS